MRSSTSPHAVAVARLAELPLPGVRRGAVAEPLRRLKCDVPVIDTLLNGGWPQGRISELYGALSCGKTRLALALLAATSRQGEVVACVDLADALHPACVAAAGADLQRILWVRPPSWRDSMRCTELILKAGGFALVVLDLGHQLPRGTRAHTWPRLLHAAEQSHTALLVLAPQRVAGSFATLSVHMQARRVCWQPGLWPLFDGFESVVSLERNKLGQPGRQVMLGAGEPPPIPLLLKEGESEGRFESELTQPRLSRKVVSGSPSLKRRGPGGG
jgi:hypothetical protein